MTVPALAEPTRLADIIKDVITGGDLARLSAEQKVNFYNAVCDSVGLNPLTQPFAYIKLQGREVLYARKEATEQLRKLQGVSVTTLTAAVVEGIYIVTAHVSIADGRRDVSTGAVAIDGLKGEARANAMLKAETKAKRRATLSICGLGLLDESEIEDAQAEETAIAAPQRRSQKAAAVVLPASITPDSATPVDDPSPPTEQSEPAVTQEAPRVPSTRGVPGPAAGSDESADHLVVVHTSFEAPRGEEPFYEIVLRQTNPGPIDLVFLTRDRGFYDIAAAHEDSGTLFAATWHTAPRPNSVKPVKVLDTFDFQP